MDSHQIGVIFSNSRGKVLDVNETFTRILGYSREEILSGSVNWRELTPFDQRHLNQWAIAEVKRSGTHPPFEKEYFHKDGRRVPVLVQTIYLKRGVGLYIGLFTKSEEAPSSHSAPHFPGWDKQTRVRHPSKLLEELVKQAQTERIEQHFWTQTGANDEVAFDSTYKATLANLARLIVPLFPVGVCFLDRELRYIQINSVLASINGYSVEQHLGRKFRELLPMYAARCEPLLRHILENGEAILNVEISGEIPGEPGYCGYWLCNYYPVQEELGQTVGVSVTSTEISRFKSSEKNITLRFSQRDPAVKRRGFL